MAGRHLERIEEDTGVGLAQTAIPVAGLRPDIINLDTGKIVTRGNIREKTSLVNEEIKSRSWFSELLRDARLGRRSAIVEVTLGALIITGAIGAGVELGLRHGMDIDTFSKLLKRGVKRKSQ
ncbi:hypothetical protein A3I48_01205 [Candidatus Daviesbacteria bacterium RIFCSPLOWO2_02_FULL_36_7]|uniref:Uncharacterized protein n=1 Tax=Candidatus Daviesbacteria bacterium RIFCSPLOWO2_02_FULL_36_7 TaxID=1797792 RepID=A0A1F5MHP2_9BACT|nr:MAG: hypothetical protein A3I48_01205 [Candidatus Daviesbacteria bacterium RIFCSPLOWO2_02_FULL_36_7]